MLYGKKVTLRILQEEDLQERVVMCNDKYIQRMMSGQVSNNEIDLDSMQKWYKARKKEENSIQFAIEYNGEYIGDIDFHSIDTENQTAEIIPMIGYRELWGKGLGIEAIELLKQYAKSQLNLKYLTLEVFPFNLRAIKAYRKLGFSFAGKLESTEMKMIVNL